MTDVGTRTIAAVRLGKAASWYRGPPYAVAEVVFDEDDFPACEPHCAPRDGAEAAGTGERLLERIAAALERIAAQLGEQPSQGSDDDDPVNVGRAVVSFGLGASSWDTAFESREAGGEARLVGGADSSCEQGEAARGANVKS